MKNKKIFALMLALVLLFAVTFVMSGCGNDNGQEKTTETDAENQQNDPAVNDELKVSFDENKTYTVADADAIASELEAEIVSGDVSRKVAFNVESTEVTEDGEYIKVTVSAEGIETVIYLPYKAEPEVYVREELKPLYDYIKKDGNKAFAFELTVGSAAAYGDTPTISSFKVMVNKTAAGLDFAVVDTSKAETAEKAIVLYKNGALKIDGVDVDPLSGFAGEFLDGDGFVIDEDAPDSFFESLSGILDLCDSMVENPGVSTMIGFKKADGLYIIDTDTQKLAAMAQLFLSGNENIGFDVNKVIDFIDAQSEGAFKAGKIKINLSLAMNGDGVVLGAALQNDSTGGSFALTAALNTADEAFALPEASAASEIKDIEIELPFSTPNGKLDLNAKIVIHTSQILTESDNDYITGSITSNGKADAAKLVVNNKFICLDVSGFAGGKPTLLYKAFEIDGQPVSIFEYIKSLNSPKDFDEDEDYNEDYGDGGDDDDDDDIYYGGYSCVSNLEDGLFILNIGATEDDLRAQINLVVNDEPVTDYQIEGFDSSESAEVEVDLIYGDLEISITVIIRDAEKAEFVGFDFEPVCLALGSDVATAEQDGLYAGIIMTDGQVQWTIYKNGFTVDKVNGETVDSGYVFNAKGDIMLSLTHKNGETTEVSAHVYDPENLEIIDVDIYPDNMYLYEYLTEEELRYRIYVSVLYDDGSWKDIETFEIIGYEPGAAEFEVKFGEYVKQITIEYDNVSDDQPTGFNISDLLNYLRVTDILASDDPVAAAKELLKQHEDLIASVFKFDAENKTLRVVINSKDGGDLVEVINIFFGIPGEEGFTDIDETYLIDYIVKSGSGMLDAGTLFQMLLGVDMNDFFSDICFEAGVSFEDGIALSLELNNGKDVKYLVSGCGVKLVDASTSKLELTDAEIASAQSFDSIQTIIVAIILSILFS